MCDCLDPGGSPAGLPDGTGEWFAVAGDLDDFIFYDAPAAGDDPGWDK